jgi:hypothetical protein
MDTGRLKLRRILRTQHPNNTDLGHSFFGLDRFDLCASVTLTFGHFLSASEDGIQIHHPETKFAG